MPLHGEIQVNDHLICSWRARNLYTLSDGWTVYDVNVAYTDNAGYHQAASFELEHKRGDGALVLAAKVLAGAGAHLRPPGTDEDGYAIRVMGERLS